MLGLHTMENLAMELMQVFKPFTEHSEDGQKQYMLRSAGLTLDIGRTVDSRPKTCSDADLEPRLEDGNGTKGGGRTLGISGLLNSKLPNRDDEPEPKGGYGGNGVATSGMSLPNFKHLNNDDPPRQDSPNGGKGGSGSGMSVPNILNNALGLCAGWSFL